MKSETPIPRLFSLLPERPKPWRQFALSLASQSGLLLVLIVLALLQPKLMVRGNRDYHFVKLVDTPVPVNHEPAPVRITTPAIPVKIPSPEAIRLPRQPKTIPTREETPIAPKVELASKVVPLPPSAPVLPKQLVKTNVFSTGSSQPPTIASSPQKVQTGGFGDPNGVAAKASVDKQVTIAQLGAFDMPSGSGNGNGLGGSQGVHGVIASSGFGAGVATGTQAANASGTVRQAGFGDAEAGARSQTKLKQPETAPTSPAEIVSKPTPAYTEEARKLHIEGEVLLEVVFESSGKLHVVRVVRGLGHGLDEAAVQAAMQIRFKPALHDGQPADSRGVLHITFQLA